MGSLPVALSFAPHHGCWRCRSRAQRSTRCLGVRADHGVQRVGVADDRLSEGLGRGLIAPHGLIAQQDVGVPWPPLGRFACPPTNTTLLTRRVLGKRLLSLEVGSGVDPGGRDPVEANAPWESSQCG